MVGLKTNPRALASAGGEEEEEALTLHTASRARGFTAATIFCRSQKSPLGPPFFKGGKKRALPLWKRGSWRGILWGGIAGWAALSAGASAQPDVTEHWYRLEVDGNPAGWMASREVAHDGRLITSERLNLRFKRAATALTLELESRFTETEAGRPISAWSRQNLGQTPVETTWKFLPREVLVEVVHGDSKTERRVALPADGWLTPGQAQARLRRLLAEGSRRFTLSSLNPQLGTEIVDTEWIYDGEEEVTADGAAVATRRFRQRESFAPGLETVVNVTAGGLLVRSSTPMMGFTMTSTLARRDDVLASREAPELMVSNYIYPDRPIEHPRRVRRAVYEISTESGAALELPSVGAQRVEMASGRTEAEAGGTRIVVEVGSSPMLDLDRAELEPYLRASTFVDHRDAGVRELLAEAAVAAAAPAAAAPAAAAPAAERAESLRAFVAEKLKDKNLDSMLATAGEVAASLSGDCTEHSVLLIALLRASGIPARAATGLVYASRSRGERDFFAYHMWTQAWVDGRWLDLDATLAVPFDAAHITFGTTALNDDLGTLAELARLAALIGGARIRVLGYRIDGP